MFFRICKSFQPSTNPDRAGMPALMLGLCAFLGACSAPVPVMPSSGASDNGTSFREVVGEICPPGQATKGNC